MIARRSALIAAVLGLLAVPALGKADWANTVAATPRGGILIGNPAAKVKITEFGSYTCSHCKTFHETGLPALKAKYIAGGNVSIEMRSFVRNGPDFSASLLVKCLAPRPALALTGQLFAEQEALTKTFMALTDADNQAIAALPIAEQPAKFASLSGLDKWAAARGVPLPAGQVCLRDKAAQARLLATRNEAMTTYKLQGTPTFGINGAAVVGAFDWAALEPAVQAALK